MVSRTCNDTEIPAGKLTSQVRLHKISASLKIRTDPFRSWQSNTNLGPNVSPRFSSAGASGCPPGKTVISKGGALPKTWMSTGMHCVAPELEEKMSNAAV